MKTIRVIAILLLAMLVPNLSQAQKLIKKELRTENDEKDGFEYRWYLYTYLSGQDTLYAAFDMDGNRITPNSSYIDNKHRGYKPYYCGGGMFMCKMKKKDATGEYNICTGYNVKGELIFPESMELSFIHYRGDEIFIVTKGAEIHSGREIWAAYNSRGEYIIPFSVGYNWIGWYGGFNCFWCKIKSGSDDIEYTYTRDGQYFAEGKYDRSGSYDKKSHYLLNDPEELAIFNQHKRRATWNNSKLSTNGSSSFASPNNSNNSIISSNICFYTRAGGDITNLRYCVKFFSGKVWIKEVSYSEARNNLAKSSSFYDDESWEDKGTESHYIWGQGSTKKYERMFTYCSSLSTSSRIVYKRHVEYTFTHPLTGIMNISSGFGCVKEENLGWAGKRFYYNYDMYVAFSPDKSSFIFWKEKSNNINGEVDGKETYTIVPSSELLPKSVSYDFLNE